MSVCCTFETDKRRYCNVMIDVWRIWCKLMHIIMSRDSMQSNFRHFFLKSMSLISLCLDVNKYLIWSEYYVPLTSGRALRKGVEEDDTLVQCLNIRVAGW